MITQTYNLNLIPDKVPVIVNCSQYDANSRTIEMNIYDGATLFTIPSGATVTVRGTKEDNTGFEYPCSFDGSTVSFVIEDQMTVYSGKVPCEIRIANRGGIIGTCNFLLNVEETTLDPDVTISETDLPLLEEAEQNAVRAENAADRAESLLDTKMDLVSSPTANNILITDGNGQAVDGGKALTNLQDKLTAGNGIQLDGSTISNVFSQLSSPNLNDIQYNFQGYVYDAANRPSGATNTGLLMAFFRNVSDYRGVQLYADVHSTNANKGKIWSRVYNTTWTSWVELYSTDSLTAGTGISISNGTISNVFSNITSGDANDITYNFQGYIANAVTNKPTTNGGGLCCVMNSGSAYGYQLFSPIGTTDSLYFRNLNNGTWRAWQKVTTTAV